MENNFKETQQDLTELNGDGNRERGRYGEDYSEEEKKVVYEPVKLEQNYRNFDYESPWEGTKYIKEQTKNND